MNWSAPSTAYTAEQLYQAMKARLLAELVAVIPAEKVQSDVGDYETQAKQLRLESI